MDVSKITRPMLKTIRNKEQFWVFRTKLTRLYEEFEAQVEALCQQHEVKISVWHSPSRIPQPKFVFGRATIDADTLYDEDEFSLLFSPKIPWDEKQKIDNKIQEKGASPQASSR